MGCKLQTWALSSTETSFRSSLCYAIPFLLQVRECTKQHCTYTHASRIFVWLYCYSLSLLVWKSRPLSSFPYVLCVLAVHERPEYFYMNLYLIIYITIPLVACTMLDLAVSIPTLVGSLLSTVSTGSIFICYAVLPRQKHFRHTLILNLAAAGEINNFQFSIL